MAPTSKDLLDLKGVVAADEFSSDGSPVDFEASVDLPKDLAATTAQFTAGVTQLLDALALHQTRSVGGTRGVSVKTADANYNESFSELVGRR